MQSRLQASKPPAPEDAKRLDDTRDRLVNVCSCLKSNVDNLAAQLKKQEPVDNQWEQWAKLSRRFRALAADCLALEQSATLRASKDTALLCAAADKLAEGFSRAVGQPRRHYVLISEAEHFGVDASAIHLAYGRLDIWNLNRVAHEFGHLWAQEFADDEQRSFVEWLTKKRNAARAANDAPAANYPSSNWNDSQAKEFFADIVAAFLMGPAYAFACIVLDLNPADDRWSDSHPSGHERAHCILMTLDLLMEKYYSYSRKELQDLVSQMYEFWFATREAAGLQATLEKPIGRKLKYAVRIAVNRLLQKIPSGQYQCFQAAHTVQNALADGRRLLRGEAQGVDILNGAWLSRWAARPTGISPMSGRALGMLQEWSHE